MSVDADQLALQLSARLKRAASDRFLVFQVTSDMSVRPFVEGQEVGGRRLEFRRGRVYYELMRRELVLPGRNVVLMDARGRLHTGEAARERLGLPCDGPVYVRPMSLPGYTAVFIQSTSHNRVLRAGSRVLYDSGE